MPTPWWTRDGFDVCDGRMSIAGQDVEALARTHGTPLYVYDSSRIEANLRRLQRALDDAGVRHHLLYALKCFVLEFVVIDECAGLFFGE